MPDVQRRAIIQGPRRSLGIQPKMDADHTLPAVLTTTLMLTSAVFFLLAGLLILAPMEGARVYGLQTYTASALFYIRAIGLRDLALASYMLGLTVAGQRRALPLILALTPIIPAGDLLLLGFAGTTSVFHYVLHGTSLAVFAGLALWVRHEVRPVR